MDFHASFAIANLNKTEFSFFMSEIDPGFLIIQNQRVSLKFRSHFVLKSFIITVSHILFLLLCWTKTRKHCQVFSVNYFFIMKS